MEETLLERTTGANRTVAGDQPSARRLPDVCEMNAKRATLLVPAGDGKTFHTRTTKKRL